MCFSLKAQQLHILLSDANGYGWAPLSTTPHRISLHEKGTIYPLTQTKISTADYTGFKIRFKETPAGIKIYLKGDNKAGRKISKLLNIKLVGTNMDYMFDEFTSIDKIGLYHVGNTSHTPTQVYVLNFSLVCKNGIETPTPLLNNTDAQKNIINWTRTIGNSWDIIYTGSYTREVEWTPAEFNKYNTLTIQFKEPTSTAIKLKIYKTKNGTVSTELFNIPLKSKNYIFELKSNSKLNGFTLHKMSLISNFQGSKLKINNIYLSN
ncbi:MAG: hypothetical protein KA206_01460 [Paludibacter sp.]|nr:hypothetical protein [Paludibacter sp.]